MPPIGAYSDMIAISNPARIFTFFNRQDINKAAPLVNLLRRSQKDVPAWLNDFAQMGPNDNTETTTQEHHESFDIEAQIIMPQRPFTEKELA